MYEYKVICGGSWVDGARYVRAAFRFPAHPGDRRGPLGFRICVKKVQHV